MRNSIEQELAFWRRRKEELKVAGSECRREYEILESANRDADTISPKLCRRSKVVANRLERLRSEYAEVSKALETCEKFRFLPYEEYLKAVHLLRDGQEPEKQKRSAPRLATFLISQLIPKSHEDSVLGDLEEEFSERCLRSGYKKAKRWYYRQAISTVRLYLTQFFIKVLKLGS